MTEETQIESPETTEQPNKDSQLTDDLEIEVPVFKDGEWQPVIEKVKLDELKKGYLRQADFTRKTQDLARQREELEKSKHREEAPADELQAVQVLKEKYGFVTKEEMETLKKEQSREQKLESLLDNNPDLSKFSDAIRDLQKTTWLEPEEIILKYWFSSSDKLARARSANRDVRGTPDRGSKGKSIKEMSLVEYAERKKTHMGKKWSFI